MTADPHEQPKHEIPEPDAAHTGGRWHDVFIIKVAGSYYLSNTGASGKHGISIRADCDAANAVGGRPARAGV